jgi:hypothetical protein
VGSDQRIEVTQARLLEEWRQRSRRTAPAGRSRPRGALGHHVDRDRRGLRGAGRAIFGQPALLEVAGRVRSTASGLEMSSLAGAGGRAAFGQWILAPNGETWALELGSDFGVLPIGVPQTG